MDERGRLCQFSLDSGVDVWYLKGLVFGEFTNLRVESLIGFSSGLFQSHFGSLKKK